MKKATPEATPKMAMIAGYALAAILLVGLVGAAAILVYKMLAFLIGTL